MINSLQDGNGYKLLCEMCYLYKMQCKNMYIYILVDGDRVLTMEFLKYQPHFLL